MLIPIERLTTGTLIYLTELHRFGVQTRCDDFGTVEAIEDDGEGFLLTLEFSLGCKAEHYVEYGGAVEYGGRGQPLLVALDMVPAWQQVASGVMALEHHHPIACLLLVIAVACMGVGIMGPEPLI